MWVPGACARTATPLAAGPRERRCLGTHGFLDLGPGLGCHRARRLARRRATAASNPAARCRACLINSAGPYNTLLAGSFMPHKQSAAAGHVGRFLTANVGPGDVFTREDLTAE